MDEVIIEKQEYLLFDKYKLNTNRNITRYEYISNVPLKVTGIINMMTPIIKVFPLTKEEMYVLLEKLAEIHAQLYEYEKVITEDEMIDFVKLAYLKRETTFITPRTMIRDFIQILDVKRQNPDKGIRDILSAYKFAVDEEQTYEDND